MRDRYVVSAPLPGRMRRIELEPGDPVVAGKTVLALFQPVGSGAARRPDARGARRRASRRRRRRSAAPAPSVERIRAELAFAQSELKRDSGAGRGAARLRRASSKRPNVRCKAQERAHAVGGVQRPRSGVPAGGRPREPAADARRAGRNDSAVLARQRRRAPAPPARARRSCRSASRCSRSAISATSRSCPICLSSAAVTFEPGQPVRIEQWGGDRALRGRVRRVEPSGFTKISALGVEEQRVNVLDRFRRAARAAGKRIGDGYRVEVRIIVWSKPDVLRFPRAACSVTRRSGPSTRWSTAQLCDTPVEIGQRSGLEAEVLSGIQQGDQIVVYPSDAIQNGVKVSPR